MMTMLLKLSGFDANGSLLIIRGGVLAAHRERRQSRLQRRDLVGIRGSKEGRRRGHAKVRENGNRERRE